MKRVMKITIPSHLSDTELVAEVKSLAGRERQTTGRLIAHLAELDARQLYLGAGFSSLFTYCREVLRLSEPAAYSRIEAARAARKYPVILDMLGDAALNLTTVQLLARHLTADNHRELLAAAAHRSKREVEELLVRYFPRPDVPASVRKVPVATPAACVAAPGALPRDATAPTPMFAPPATPRPVVTPLSPDRYQIRFTASAQTCEKLRLAQDLLRHAVPNGDTAEIIDRALTALLDVLARKKFAATQRPRASHATARGSRYIAAKVRREVWLRDRGRCAFVGHGRRRCGSRAFLEFHHLDPYGVGGEPTVDNIELRCRAHNAYEADLFYGPNPTWSRQLVPDRVEPVPDGSAQRSASAIACSARGAITA